MKPPGIQTERAVLLDDLIHHLSTEAEAEPLANIPLTVLLGERQHQGLVEKLQEAGEL